MQGHDDRQEVIHESIKAWRYMKFSRFVWLLQKRQLWLSRVDVLDDPWEISLAGDQLEHVISRHPISPLPSSGVVRETAIERSDRIINAWRKQTFINCWRASDYESHALWRIYCAASEGVAIQTTLGKLKASVGDLPVYPVTYQVPGSKKQTPTHADLVTKKRPMFSYEQEVRIVRFTEEKNSTPEPTGLGLNWDLEKWVESIRVHPEADHSFMETVTAAVECYAPALRDKFAWSEMRSQPPFRH